MVKMSFEQLKEVLEWASRQKDKKGRSLLEKARESIETGSYLKYNTTLETSDREFLSDGTPIVYWDCDCLASNEGKHKDKPCKHVIAHIILAHEEELRKSPKWDRWFSSYYNKQIEKALRAFEQF